MSTLGVGIIVTIVALAGVGAMGLLRLREQKRQERARQAILLTDDISKYAEVLSTLMAYLSSNAKQLLAQQILSMQQQLSLLGIKSTQVVKRAANLAQQVADQAPNKTPPPLPKDSKQAQRFSEQTRRLGTLVRQAYQRGQIDKNSASAIAKEARTLNLKVCYGVYESKARAALAMNSPSRATRFVDKAKALLQASSDEIATLNKALEALQADVNAALAELGPEETPSRLEAGTKETAENDEAGNKKDC